MKKAKMFLLFVMHCVGHRSLNSEGCDCINAAYTDYATCGRPDAATVDLMMLQTMAVGLLTATQNSFQKRITDCIVKKSTGGYIVEFMSLSTFLQWHMHYRVPPTKLAG
jgi:hypothetical protein